MEGILLVSESEIAFDAVKGQFKRKFGLPDSMTMAKRLGVIVEDCGDCMKLQDDPMVKWISRDFKTMDHKPEMTPLSFALELRNDDSGHLWGETRYLQPVLSFLHVANTDPPYIAFEMRYLSRFMHRPAVQM